MPDPLPLESTPPERKILGVTFSDFTKVVAGAIAAVVAGMIGSLFTYWLTTSSPHLSVAVSPAYQLPEDKTDKRFGITVFSVTNNGSKEAENVECTFTTPTTKHPFILGTAENLRKAPRDSPCIMVIGEHLHPITTIKTNKVTINVASMNPGESFGVGIFGFDVPPERPVVKVRGKNVVGVDASPGFWSEVWRFLRHLAFAIVVWFVIIVIIAFCRVLWLRYKSNKKSKN